MILYGSSFINLIFAFREVATALAHVGSHCVTGIALPPVDATFLSIVHLAVRERMKEKRSCPARLPGGGEHHHRARPHRLRDHGGEVESG
jgi:hypothetical protein